MKRPLYTTDLASHDVKMPGFLKFILKSFVSPVENPKAQGDPKKMRELERKMDLSFIGKQAYGKTTPLWKVEDHKIPSDNPDLHVRVYSPSEKKKLPGIIFYHGGGYVIGSVTVYDKLCRNLSQDLEAVVISVDYRLAPEFKFPAAPNDGWTAVQWVFDQSQVLGVDLAKIFVMGDSAGGGIAAVMASKSREEKKISIAGQILVYPWLDGNLDKYLSMHKFQSGYVLTYRSMQYFRDAYISKPEDLSHPDFSPLCLKDYSDFCPTFLITASHDPLRDQAYAFAHKLHNAGNQLTFKNYQPTMHGFLSIHKVIPLGKQMYADIIAKIKTMIE